MAAIRHESILGLDNIRLDLPVASVGSRSLAAFLDYLILIVLMFLWLLLSALIGAFLSSAWMPVILIVGLFLLNWGYFAGFEIATGGRTPGKMALRLRVVTAEGGSPGAGALLMRNLIRAIDLIFGVPMMAIDPLARRLGDRLAGTLVVHDRGREAAPVLGRIPPGWGARELAVVEAFLARARSLENTAESWQMADHILDRIRADAPELLAGIDTRRDPVAALRQALQVEDA
ncbi:MAG TPA: RDD family protein [Thermoanaerobaculia bacterium]|nr:RDD family protein [Thermoanaerobaculia bacterium]